MCIARHGLFRLAALTGLGLLVGCGGSATDRQAVSGTVTFKGSPLDQGTIQFFPLDPKKGTFTGERIENGRYTIARQNGLVPGAYRVQISSGIPNSKAEEAAPGESGPPAVERIPPEYSGENSRLKAEVKADGPNTFDFTIP